MRLTFQRSLKFALVLAFSLLAALTLLACGDSGPRDIASIRLMPQQFQSDTTITGTVTTFSQEGAVAILGMVDNEHILECRNILCPGEKIYFMNLSDQPLPRPGDVIEAQGYFQETGGFWIFRVSSYTVRENIIHLLHKLEPGADPTTAVPAEPEFPTGSD